MTLAMKYDEWREEGLAEGRAEGLKEGLQEGLNAGLLQKALETAKNFIRMNYPLEQIAQGTGLTLEQVQVLKEEM